MKVLVTGANGLLGTHIILELLNRGYEVNAIVRRKDKMKLAEERGLKVFEGDFTIPEDIGEAIKGCHYVIHAAALTSQSIRSYKPFKQINVEGTKNILEAAKKFSIQKIVYVSTANAFGYGTMDKPGTEENPSRFPFTKSHYAYSKTEAQKLILKSSQEIPVNIVNPTFMLGPYGTGNSSDKIIRWGLHKRILFYPPGGKNFIHVSDVAYATVNILEKAPSGEAYLLSNENLSYHDFFQKVIHHKKHKSQTVKLPKAILLPAGFAGSLMRALGKNTELSLTNTRILCVENYYSNAKAKPYFPAQLKTTDETIRETIHWLKEQNIIAY